MSSTAIRRIQADIRELRADKNPMIHAAPLIDNLFEWHFTIHGTPNSDYEGGIYHGRILLPPEWPMKPPQIIFCTVNGRFEVNTPVCLSFTSFHPEEWQPSWGIRTILEAIISFFPIESEGAIGSISCSSDLRKHFARESRKYVCPNCGPIVDLIAPLSKEEIQSYYTTPISPEEVKKEEEVKVEEVKEEEVKEEEVKEEEEIKKEEEIEEEEVKEVKEEKKEEEEVKEEEVKEEEVKEEEVKEEEEVFDIKEILNGYRYSRPTDSAMLMNLLSSIKEKEPVKTGPSVFPSVIAEGLEKKPFEYFEEIRQRHTVSNKEGLPPFVPVFVPVIVPMEKKEEKKVDKKGNLCLRVFSVLVTIVMIIIYGLIFYYQFMQ